MKSLLKISSTTLVFFLLSANLLLAQDLGLIVCEGPNCDFNKLIELVNQLIKAAVMISSILAVCGFVWAGGLLLFSGGDEGARKKAQSIFWNVVWGYLWILSAWLVVYTITKVLLDPNDPDYRILK